VHEEFLQTGIEPPASKKLSQSLIVLGSSIFANSQEYQAVDGFLDGEVEVAGR